jgi:hypothetical protein
MSHVPTDAPARKALPLCSGVVDYFPDALLAVAELSRIGNEQHNPGEPLHWSKEKSTDEADALMRHLVDRGKLDEDGVRHSTKVAWRALALLQREIEAEKDTELLMVECSCALGCTLGGCVFCAAGDHTFITPGWPWTRR